MRFNICSPTCYSSVFFIHFLLLLLIYRANADVAVPITEPKITYDGFQVIRIDIQNNLALVEGLIEELELPTWGGALQENRFVDAVIPPENREEVISTLEGDGVEFVYLHEDLGASISAQEEYPEYSRTYNYYSTVYSTFREENLGKMRIILVLFSFWLYAE